MKKLIGALVLISAFVSCSKDNALDLSGGNTGCSTNAVSYATTIATIMTNNCNYCHSGSTPSGGIITNTYAGLSALPNERFLGAVKHANGYNPMPSNAPKLSDCDINKIEAWVNQGKLNN